VKALRLSIMTLSLLLPLPKSVSGALTAGRTEKAL